MKGFLEGIYTTLYYTRVKQSSVSDVIPVSQGLRTVRSVV